MKLLFSTLTLLAVTSILLNVPYRSEALTLPENSTMSDISSTISSVTLTTSASEELSARERWRMTEKTLKQITSTIVKKILPMIVRSSETMNISTRCSRHLMRVIGGMKQMKLWPFKMLDTWGKIPNGILSGTITSLGDYDTCLNLIVSGHFQGEYCTVDIRPPLPKRTPFVPIDLQLPELSNFTDERSLVADLMRKAQHFYYLTMRTSVCVPSTCSREDVQAIAEKVMESTELGWEVEVPNCEIKKAVEFDRSDIVIMCALGIILALALAGTMTDVIMKLSTKDEEYKNNVGFSLQCLLCFSVYSNTLRLLKKDNSPDTIKIFHGMKVITVMWVILNHTYYYINLEIFGNLLYARTAGKDIAFQFIVNGFLNVETFFFISAVLVVYGRMKSKDREFTVFVYIFRRLWRLTPPFMFVIAFTFLVRHMGSGPIWQETVGTLVDKCKKNWWTNLLYFNNLIGSEDMCLQWSWYIAVDTHLYFLAFFVLLPIKQRPRLGFFILGLIFTTGIVLTAVLHVIYELHPTAIYAFPHPDDINYFIDHGYFRTYLHIVTYCVGMTVGYLIWSKPKLHIPIVANVVGWIVAFVAALTVLYGVYDWNQGNTPTLAVSTLYQCTSKLVWALALGWVTVICYTGNGGIIYSILSWNALVPLSRLTYMAYLVHPLIQHIYIGSTRTLLQTEHRTMAFMFVGYVVFAFMGAYVFSQLFESPFMALEKVLFARLNKRRSSKKTASDLPKIETNGKSEHLPKNGINGVFTVKITKNEVLP